jgi:hypothetical protein
MHDNPRFRKNYETEEGFDVNKKKVTLKEDVNYEGKDELYLDEDRMINEGLSGGSVHMREDSTNIEEARELPKEEPPR